MKSFMLRIMESLSSSNPISIVTEVTVQLWNNEQLLLNSCTSKYCSQASALGDKVLPCEVCVSSIADYYRTYCVLYSALYKFTAYRLQRRASLMVLYVPKAVSASLRYHCKLPHESGPAIGM